MRHGNHLPFEAFGRMDGEYLDAVRRHLHLPWRESVLHRVRCGEERQEPGDRGGRVVGVVGHHDSELVEVFATDSPCGRR